MIWALLMCLQERVEMKEHASYYLLQKPAAYTDRASWPLVLDLHAEQEEPAAALDRWKIPAADAGSFVVAPAAPKGAWTVEFLRSCLADVKTRYRIDPERVLLSGASRGAGPALQWAATDPELFAGCALLRPRGLIAAKRAPPCIFVAGEDAAEGPRSLAAALALKKAGVAVEMRPPVEGPVQVLSWFKDSARPGSNLEAVDEFMRQERYLDASLVAMSLMERPGWERYARMRLGSLEGVALIALGKVEIAMSERRYLDAWLRCRAAAVQFAWLPTGERIRKRLGELESHAGVKKAREIGD